MKSSRPALGLLALARATNSLSLPYNPTRILLPANSSHAYVFQSATLYAIDITNALSTSNFVSGASSDGLPFLKHDEQISYTPVVEPDGSIAVVTGNCSEGASSMEIWRYSSHSEDGAGKYVWSQRQVSSQRLGDQSSLAGSNYLAAGVAFSSRIQAYDQDTNIFTFGGMCPSDSSTESTWQSDAVYSNSMLALAPQGQMYDLSIPADRGPPIAQAGISITPLQPTYSTDSNGEATAQQQEFVLLGGHTQGAFINTSQVALFSLPLQSWSFVPVMQPSSSKTDLALRQSVQEVTPRSGHTAVLSEDGESIIVFGGWVGDIHTPAQPQLAILDLGAGFGGTGDWSWHIPDTTGSGFTSGSGIYGHGATLLPGGIMMVVGGYDIPVSTSRRLRRGIQSDNNRAFFYNTTSNTWLQSYTPPAGLYSQGQAGPLSNTSQKVGLGTGLGIGAALLVSLLAFYFWYSKHVRDTQEKHERALLTYTSDGSSVGNLDQPFLESGGFDGRGGDNAAVGRYWPTGSMAGNEYPQPPPMQHTTGMWVNVPSPTRGLRKGSAQKNYQYQAAPRFDEKRLSMTSNIIHPIAEHENEDGLDTVAGSSDLAGLSDAEAKLREVKRMLHSEDPFNDPPPNPLGSHPVSSTIGGTVRRVPTGASRISVPPRKPLPSKQETENWIVEGGPSDQDHENDEGRESPSRSDDRTSSTLSEQSQRSIASTTSITRTMSTRTGALLAAAVAADRQPTSHETSPQEERTNTMTTNRSRSSTSYFRTRARSSTNDSVTPGAVPKSAGSDGESFMTARSNFAQLRSEGEVLLGGRPTIDRDDPYQRALAAHGTTQARNVSGPNPYGLPLALPNRRRPGWMGSLRRALNVVSMTDRSFSLTSSNEPYRDDPRSSSSSPTKERPAKVGSGPRRSASDGSVLLRQKRGQSDWSEKEWEPYRDDPDAGDWGEPRSSTDKRQAEEDWDVEGAASKRDFQVMFTVPKARLRVVNDDMDRASLRSASDSAVSRTGSVKDLRREESQKTLKARTEDRHRLPSTEEENDDSEKPKAL